MTATATVSFLSVSAGTGGLGIEQPMQMHDEVAHLRVVDGLLRLALPYGISARVVRIEADDLDLAQVLELAGVERAQFAAEDQMKKLFLWSGHRLTSLRSTCPALTSETLRSRPATVSRRLPHPIDEHRMPLAPGRHE